MSVTPNAEPRDVYLVIARDGAGRAELRAQTRQAHLAWLSNSALPVLMAGPMLDGDGSAVIGSLLIVEAGSLAELSSWAAQDPYAQAGLFEAVELRPYKVVIGGFTGG